MRLFLLAMAGIGAAALGACGSSVTTGTGGNADDGGSDDVTSNSGAGASGATGSTSTASGMPTASNGAGGSGGAALCQQACDRLAMLGCQETEGCAEECQAGYAMDPQCAPQLDQLTKCVSTTTSCSFDECGPAVEAYVTCIDGSGCGPAECGGTGSSGGQTFCTCSATCDGVEVTADCTSFAGAGDAKCDCYVNGMMVGGCAEPVRLQCEVEASCCNQFF